VTALAESNIKPDLSKVSMEDLVTEMLIRVGEDPNRPGLVHTPYRVARAWEFFSSGYRENIHELVNGALFEERCDEMVVVSDIDVFSQCEHHMLPFYGVCHVGYLPKGKLIGLSKIPRIVETFSRRLQLQERLTQQIAECLHEILSPQGVGVVMECRHMCMMMRGVQKAGSNTITSAMLGLFRSNHNTRSEFLEIIKNQRKWR